MPSSSVSSQPRDQTQVSHTAGRIFIIWDTREGPRTCYILLSFCGTFDFSHQHLIAFGIWVFCPLQFNSFQFTQSCLTLCSPMDCSMPGFPIHHQLQEPAQIHVHWISDPIQPSCPLLFPSPPGFYLALPQGLFQWVSSSQQVAKVLEYQLQHQSCPWILRTDFLWIDWLDHLAVQGTLKSLLQHHSVKKLILWNSAFFISNSHIRI